MNHKEIERWHRLRNLKKAAQFLMAAALAFLAVGYLAERYFSGEKETLPLPAKDMAGMRIEEFSYSSPGAHAWELEAKTATVSEALDEVDLLQPKIMYRVKEGGKVVVKADSGRLDRKTQNVSARGDVVIQYVDLTLTMDDFQYYHDRLVAETKSSVSLKGRDLEMTGKGMRVSFDKEEVIIEDQVNARLFNMKWVKPGDKLPM
ncbi:MAG: LPS export ABC transporter periplasmic protein LptC [Pseudomonadota bacterium]